MPDVLAAGEVTALDIYVESSRSGNDHLRRMGELAERHGLHLRAHVEQFSTNDSVPVALEAGARSVDHLACCPDDIAPLAASETAAVLLLGAAFLGDEQLAPGRALADAGAICALATDHNPGTSPMDSLPLIIGLAVRRYRWSVLEALLACTLNAAWVLRPGSVRLAGGGPPGRPPGPRRADASRSPTASGTTRWQRWSSAGSSCTSVRPGMAGSR